MLTVEGVVFGSVSRYRRHDIWFLSHDSGHERGIYFGNINNNVNNVINVGDVVRITKTRVGDYRISGISLVDSYSRMQHSELNAVIASVVIQLGARVYPDIEFAPELYTDLRRLLDLNNAQQWNQGCCADDAANAVKNLLKQYFLWEAHLVFLMASVRVGSMTESLKYMRELVGYIPYPRILLQEMYAKIHTSTRAHKASVLDYVTQDEGVQPL